MNKKLKKLYKSAFVRNTAKLASGTAVAQLLALLFLPILSRTYSQEAFGYLATFSAVVGLIASFATLKYDTALVLPKDNKDAYALLKVSNIVTLIITLVCVLILFIPVPFFKEYRGLQIFIGIGVILNVNYNNSALWNIRFKHFNSTSISRVIQSLAIFTAQYLLYTLFELKGLIIGNIIGVFIAGLYLILTREFKWKIYNGVSKEEMLVQAKRYIDFPKYFTLSNAILSLSSNLPILLFVKFIPMAQVGIYGVAVKIIAQPVTLIANTLKSVVLGDMAEKKNNQIPIKFWFLKIVLGLSIISLFASAFLFFFSEDIVTLFLGSDWTKASLYIKMLIPLLISKMIGTPGVAAVRVFEMQKYTLKYSIISLTLKAFTLLGLFMLSDLSFEFIIFYYSIINLLLVVGNNIYILLEINRYEKEIKII